MSNSVTLSIATNSTVLAVLMEDAAALLGIVGLVKTGQEITGSAAIAEALKAHMVELHGKTVDEVYWRFASAPGDAAHG